MGVPLNIDWQQILLHMFNLIILTGGLYFLLYQPVTAFMKKRQIQKHLCQRHILVDHIQVISC